MLHLHYDENGHKAGQLSFKRTSLLTRLPAQPSVISILSYFAADRQAVEDFICKIYAESYGANISVHYPILMSVRNAEGEILAAAGFRAAASETLFLEQYLPQPVEQVLNVSRHEIVEIGNLASSGGGASVYLFAALAAYLNDCGFSKAVVTSTELLKTRFQKMGLRPQCLAPADPNRLLKGGESWGSYYDTNPHVLSGSLSHSCKRLKTLLGAEYRQENPSHLFPRLHYRAEGEC